MKTLRTFLICFLFSGFVSAQDFQYVPKNPQQIVKFKAQLYFQNEKIIKYQLFDNGQKMVVLRKSSVQIWDAQTPKLVSEISHGIENIDKSGYFSTVSPNAKKLVIFDYSDFRASAIFFPKLAPKTKVTAIVYDLTNGKQLAVLSGDTMSIRDAKWSENGETFVTTSERFGDDENSEICFWDGETLAKRECASLIGRVGWNHLSKDGKNFFVAIEGYGYGFDGNRIMVWDAEKAEFLHTFEAGNIWAYDSSHVSADGRYLATQSEKSVAVWEIGNNFPRKAHVILPRKSNWISFGSFSPDAKYFALKNGKNGTEVYETETGQLKYRIPGNDMTPRIWVDEGKILISNFCGEAKAHSLETGNLLYHLKLVCKTTTNPNNTTTDDEDDVLLHPEGKYFLTKSGTAVRIWNTATGELLQTVINPNRESGKAKNPKSDDKIQGRKAFWSNDGRYLYVLDDNQRSVLQYEFVGK